MAEKLLLKLNANLDCNKYLRFPNLLLLAIFFGSFAQMSAQTNPFGATQESINYDFNQCRSFAEDNSNMDYSEFMATTVNTCSSISGGQIYRDSGKHSCTDDEFGNAGYAACFQSSLDTDYTPDHTLAIRFDVELSGDNGKKARLDAISFKQLAPHNYLWTSSIVSGSNTGPNNYPTKFGIRVLKGGQEIFRESNLPTTQSWDTSSFDFTKNTDFSVDAGMSSTFTFELFSYSPIGNGASVSAWDLDDLKIFSSCGLDCDITIDAGEDVTECTDENVQLTATYQNNNECAAACVYPVLDTAKCGGSSEEVYLFVPSGPVSERKFQATSQNFETFNDGTARYTATATNGLDVIEVDMLYSGRTTNAPVNSPKEHSCGADQEIAGFEYYPTLNGTVVSQNHGTFYATSMGPSFQIGIGADVTRSGFGASGWFDLSGGNGYYSRGDVNIPLGDCDEQQIDEVTFLWSTTDGTIVGANDQETIEVSESGSYTVTVTNCIGCEAADTVEVNILEKVNIGDFVFNDINRNGLQDDGEAGVDGISVTLNSCDGIFFEETVTANGGEYSFEVCPGQYQIVFGDLPDGYAFTSADSGDDALDSDANPNGVTPCFTVADLDDFTIDAGIVALCTIDPAVEGDKEICLDEEATLTASGGKTYLWSTGETTASIKVSPKETTTYTVVVSDSTIADCSKELSFTVEVQSIDIDAGLDVTINSGDSTTLTVNGASASDEILWSTGETTESITVTPETTTTYSVTVVNTLGCMGEDSVTVEITNACGIEPAFKILPRDQPGQYTPGYETAACIGDNFYLWMYDPEKDVLGVSHGQNYNQWTFTFELPNGEVIVQEAGSGIYGGNNRIDNLDLNAEDFGEYKVSWIAPSGCTGTTVFTLNFPDEGCGDNGTRISDVSAIDAVYPMPAAAGSELTLEVSTESGSIGSLADNDLSGKTPNLFSRKEKIQVSLYNFNGRKIGETQTFDVEQGKVKVYYQLGNLATGNYIIKVEGDSWSDSKQIMVK